jgi:hypothetical protein
LRAQLRIWPAIDESKPHRIPFADQYDQRPKHGQSKLTRAPCQGVKILAVLATTNLWKSALVGGLTGGRLATTARCLSEIDAYGDAPVSLSE